MTLVTASDSEPPGSESAAHGRGGGGPGAPGLPVAGLAPVPSAVGLGLGSVGVTVVAAQGPGVT